LAETWQDCNKKCSRQKWLARNNRENYMADNINPEFIALAKEVAKTGQPCSLTIRQLLNHFGVERRGREITQFINYKLKYLGLETDPKFDQVLDQVHIESTVKIIPRPIRPRGRPRKYGVTEINSVAEVQFISPANSEKLETPKTEIIVSEEDEEAEELRRPYLTIGLLASANKKPDSVRSNVATTIKIYADFVTHSCDYFGEKVVILFLLAILRVSRIFHPA
jgi:hypothetical protein